MRRKPESKEEWQDAANMAAGGLMIHAAICYGLIKGGPKINAKACAGLLSGAEQHGIKPAAGAELLLLNAWQHFTTEKGVA